MLNGEVFIRKRLRTVDTSRTCSITIEEITTLAHKILDLRNISTRAIHYCTQEPEKLTIR
jgi:hypothetical protein